MEKKTVPCSGLIPGLYMQVLFMVVWMANLGWPHARKHFTPCATFLTSLIPFKVLNKYWEYSLKIEFLYCIYKGLGLIPKLNENRYIIKV